MGNCAECIKGNNSDDEKIDNDKQTKYDPLLEDQKTGGDIEDGNSSYNSFHSNQYSTPKLKSNQSTEEIDIINQNPEYEQQHSQNRGRQKVSVQDFDFLKVLGRGSFGKVLLVSRKQTGKLYAMKILKKNIISQKNQVIHTKSERSILQNMNSPFIVQLHFAFQSADRLYFVMDFMIGGELFFHLRRSYKFNEDRSKLYCAELVAAIEYLHNRDIIYRDLKPENILLGGDGHLKIADFGLSKQGVTDGVKTNTFCGTPEYLAPEILLGKGHDKSVDWYSLGCLLYEMLSGAPPFYSKDKHRMFRNRLERPIEMRSWFSPKAISLIKGLLQKDPTKRIGYKGAFEIKQHPFFAEINWEQLLQKKYQPPFKPKVANDKDLRHFDKMFTNETLKDSPIQGTITGKVNDNYDGFTYGGHTMAGASMMGNTMNAGGMNHKIAQQKTLTIREEEEKQDQDNVVKEVQNEEDEEGEGEENGNKDTDPQQEDLQDDNFIEVNHNFSLKPDGLNV